MSKIKINQKICKKCGTCAEVCPENLFVQENGKAPHIVNGERCTLCGHCVSVCPAHAIVYKDFQKIHMKDQSKRRIGHADYSVQ